MSLVVSAPTLVDSFLEDLAVVDTKCKPLLSILQPKHGTFPMVITGATQLPPSLDRPPYLRSSCRIDYNELAKQEVEEAIRSLRREGYHLSDADYVSVEGIECLIYRIYKPKS